METLAINCNPMTSWSDLPTDILIAIMSFMAPHDIIALRKVSRLLADTTRERSVWIDALRRFCADNDVYAPSFSLEEMSTHELEHAATGCRRFTSRLRTNFLRRNSVSPLSIRYSAHEEEFDRLRLIPGGRFVVTVSRCTLWLWDLGSSPKTSGVKLVTSCVISGVTMIHGLRIRASKYTSDALVFVSTTGSEGSFCLHVFSVLPHAQTPHFNLFSPVLSLPVENERPIILGLTNQHIALCADTSTVLWDFIHDCWISWREPLADSENSCYICNNNIVLVLNEAAQIYVASLPALHPRSASTSPPEIESLNILQVHKLTRFDQSEQLVSCIDGMTRRFHGRETSTAEEPMHIDVLSKDGTNNLISHFAVLPAAGSDTALCELSALAQSPLEVSYLGSYCQHLQWIYPHFVLSFDIEGTTALVSLIDLDGTSSASVLTGTLVAPGLLEGEICVDFCSFSGRGCARVPTSDNGGFKLMVMDYVLPKQS
ncbi:F-box domain-containing protein [Mycena venus]|uniref:F-box domain-containing protein n=1 Tax=Mycena venus TaxID=2733690 RepID=A0A8H6Y8S0_9AGAR|nr:F-box domain-containing protein [Mycena venus]